MSFILLGILNSQVSGVAGGPYFATTTTGGTWFAVDTDSQNSIYTCSPYNTGFYHQKWDKDGVLQYSRRATNAYSNESFGLSVNSNDEIFVGAFQDIFTGSIQGSFRFDKYNTSGSLQISRYAHPSGAGAQPGRNVYYNEVSNEILVTGHNNQGNETGIISRWNSSGSYLGNWNLDAQVWWDLAIDSSGNIYTCGSFNGDYQLNKFNSTGTLQWQKTIAAAGNFGFAYNFKVGGPNEDVYIFHGSDGFGSYQTAGYIQIDSSGNHVRSRYYQTDLNNFYRSGAIDNDGNVYQVGKFERAYFDGTTSEMASLVKWDASGSLQYSRAMGMGNGREAYWYDATIDSAGDLILAGTCNWTTGRQPIMVKYPADGSITGTFVGLPNDYKIYPETYGSSQSFTPTITNNSLSSISYSQSAGNFSPTLSFVSPTETQISIET